MKTNVSNLYKRGAFKFDHFDIVSVGHFCIDSISLPNKQRPYNVLGGSVTYVSLSARRLGANVSVMSKVGGDFPEAYVWWLSQEGVDLSEVVRIKHEKTTRFMLEYNSDMSNRTLRLIKRAPPITVEDLPNSLEAKVVHLAPIANEISHEVAVEMKKSAEVLSLDPQGLVRAFNEEGFVANEPLRDKRILELLNLYKSSHEEIEAVTGEADLASAIKAVHNFGVETVIVTLGAKGALVSIAGDCYSIPPYRSSRIVDPTGAGDTFIGGFLAEYIRGRETLWCACVGSAAASMVVEGVGPTFFGDKEEIYRRANVLYEKEIKQ